MKFNTVYGMITFYNTAAYIVKGIQRSSSINKELKVYMVFERTIHLSVLGIGQQLQIYSISEGIICNID